MFRKLFSRKREGKTVLVPNYERHREKCPFYGFSGMALVAMPQNPILMDSRGNQCALEGGEHRPCQMAMHHESVDWEKCPYNCEENLEIIEGLKTRVKVAPDEFWPENERSWNGISLPEWFDYVMKTKETVAG